jgi:hypothetical protein
LKLEESNDQQKVYRVIIALDEQPLLAFAGI